LAIVVNTLSLMGRSPLYRDLLADASFHKRLRKFDEELGQAARAEGCLRCSGVLHSARFPRKPRGRPAGLGVEDERRISFCCAVDGCRKRRTPASVRFLGSKLYLAAVVVLVAVLRHGITAARIQRLSELAGIDRRTIERWQVWWRKVVPATAFWRNARAAFMPPVDEARLPDALIERFPGDEPDRLIALLRFLAPSPEALACALSDGDRRPAEDARRGRSSAVPTLDAP
jgi:hypothetical protein